MCVCFTEVVLSSLGAEGCLDVLSEADLPLESVSSNFFSKCVTSHQQTLKSR